MPKTRNRESVQKARSGVVMIPSLQAAVRVGPLSLPLLEGLSRRPGEADSIVHELFSQWKAAIRITRAMEFLWFRHQIRIGETEQKQKKRRGKQVSQGPPPKRRRRGGRRTKESQSMELDLSPTQEKEEGEHPTMSQLFLRRGLRLSPFKHWLLQSMISASLPERQVAFRILSQGCPLDDSSIWTCIELLCSTVYSETTYRTNASSNVVGCIAFLKHIVINVLSDSGRLGFCRSSSVGLTPMCETLWRLALLGKHSDRYQSQALLRVCLSFVDLLHSTILKGTSEAVKEIHKMLWSAGSEGHGVSQVMGERSFHLNSPLACLVATYHLWRELPKDRSTENYTGLLNRLIDPSVLPDIHPGDSGTALSRAGDHISRLSETFRATKGTSQLAPNKTGKKEGSNDDDGAGGNGSALAVDDSGARESLSAAAVAAILESSSENRSVMESVSRLIGSLYGSSNETRGQNTDRVAEGDGNEFQDGAEFHPMNETDDEDDDCEVIEEGMENEEKTHDHDEVTDNMNVDEGEQNDEDGEDAEQASSEEEINQDEDEEIESDDDDEDEEIAVEEDVDDDEEDDEVMIHDDDLPGIEEGLLEIQRGLARHEKLSATASDAGQTTIVGFDDRSQVFIQAAMQVLMIQYPITQKAYASTLSPLSVTAENALMESILKIVKPEKKPFDAKVCLRRAPTQEEFFRGSLSKNPISLLMLNSRDSGSHGEPTVRDLRQYIANELQMSDSAELLELLIANKILDVDLKLRVINQTVWKDHCLHLSNSSSGSTLSSLLGGGRSRSFPYNSSGISLMLGSSLARTFGSSSSPFSATVVSPDLLPPMMITYRLIGVDGEATEDSVTTLNDPEAPSESASEQEIEQMMERQFGSTRAVMKGRGGACLMRSFEKSVYHTLRKIRRDDVGDSGDHSRDKFNQTVSAGLSLILCCAKLPSNRQLLLKSRAPTTLLRLLLDVLHSLEDDRGGKGSKTNPTAKGLQELIEVLASDISRISSGDCDSRETDEEDDTEEDASTLRLLIQGIETSTLSSPLRNIIAKLLPYLTYGKPKLSEELATEFMEHVATKYIGEYESENTADESLVGRSALMDTFIHASISLPANEVCDSLRAELVNCGFVERIAKFILQKCPDEPPPWSAALWPEGIQLTMQNQKLLHTLWHEYSQYQGLTTCFEMLVGLSKEHQQTQMFLGNYHLPNLSFIQLCHWLEATSDSTGVSIKKLALLAETLLDHLVECETAVSTEIRVLRKTTRDRKKEIAMQRRNKTLLSMSKSGSGGVTVSQGSSATSSSTSARGTAASLLGPVLGLFHSSTGEAAVSGSTSTSSSKARKKKLQPKAMSKPSWMEEMETLEDETGLVCSVCQEGIKSQPQSLLGLYCYVKRVSLSSTESRLNIDGTTLLTILPLKLPSSLLGRASTDEWYQTGKAAGNELKEAAKASLANRRRDSHYTTTVSAANAIHISCHAKARQADRNHPKAPKSEWEGATLRNSRVNCNVILPLVSSRSSQVPLGFVEQSLTDHQVAVANLIGARPKSNLWMVLHDVRLLLLRMAYGEALNADCGGGSLLSNLQLLFYQLSMAKSFESEAQVDSPASSLHARALSAGFLAARDIISADDYDSVCAPSLIRSIADSSVMAALTCILFHNTKDDCGSSTESSDDVPHPKRRWILGNEGFLRGLLNCAGCRHALGIHDSGCISGRVAGAKHIRSSAFTEWVVGQNDESTQNQDSLSSSTIARAARRDKSSRASVDDFANALRPFIVLYAMMDQLSSDFTPSLDDQSIEDSANRLSTTIESCQRSKNIHELFQRANVNLSEGDIMKELQRGMTAA